MPFGLRSQHHHMKPQMLILPYQFYGEYSGCRIARKHIAWYTKGLRSSNEFRQNMYKVESTAEQAIVVENYFNQLLAEGNLMSDVQVEQVNLLETH
mgnify:CR=1 FL=1